MMEREQPPEPCPDPWCDGPIGHMQCVADRWGWALRTAGVSAEDMVTPDLSQSP